MIFLISILKVSLFSTKLLSFLKRQNRKPINIRHRGTWAHTMMVIWRDVFVPVMSWFSTKCVIGKIEQAFKTLNGLQKQVIFKYYIYIKKHIFGLKSYILSLLTHPWDKFMNKEGNNDYRLYVQYLIISQTSSNMWTKWHLYLQIHTKYGLTYFYFYIHIW